MLGDDRRLRENLFRNKSFKGTDQDEELASNVATCNISRHRVRHAAMTFTDPNKILN